MFNLENPYLSIVIPAFNEEARIVSTLNKIVEYMNQSGFAYEIIVVDDGSNDDTMKVAQECEGNIRVISQPKNMGKGAAIRTGMMSAVGRLRLFTDADLSTPIYELKKLLAKIEDGYDIAIGSRALNSDMIKEHQPFYREMMGKTFNKLVQFFVFKGIQDTQCGFKLFSSNAAEDVFSILKTDGFGFDVEALYLANNMNFKIAEVSVEWYNDERSKVNPITDSFKMLAEILRIKRLHRS